MAERAPMRLHGHGPRLFVQLQAGLPFLPVPPEMYVRARQSLNLVMSYKLKADSNLATVSVVLLASLTSGARQKLTNSQVLLNTTDLIQRRYGARQGRTDCNVWPIHIRASMLPVGHFGAWKSNNNGQISLGQVFFGCL